LTSESSNNGFIPSPVISGISIILFCNTVIVKKMVVLIIIIIIIIIKRMKR